MSRAQTMPALDRARLRLRAGPVICPRQDALLGTVLGELRIEKLDAALALVKEKTSEQVKR